MKDHVEHIVFFRELTPEQEAELRQLLRSRPEVETAFVSWLAYRDALGRQINEAAGDRELFALFALSEYGYAEALSSEERARVIASAPSLRAAIVHHPGLRSAVEEVSAAAREFDKIWRERTGADTEPTWTGRHERTESGPYQDDRPRRMRARSARWGVRLALGSALVLFVSLLVFVVQRDHAMTTVTTADGETRVVDLGDGSTARLLGTSRLSYTPLDDAAPLGRQAHLDGRGYFDIASTGSAYVVKTETAQITVLGTSFGVRAEPGETEVVLADGRLSVSSRGEPSRSVLLTSGQMSRIAEDGRPTAPESVDVYEHLAWTGLLVFSSTPLPDILSTLEDAYQVELSATPDLQSERITGQFERGQELVEILSTISAAVDAEIQAEPSGGYRLVPH